MDSKEPFRIKSAETGDVEELTRLELKAWIAQYVSSEYGVSETEIKDLDTSARIRDWKHILQSVNYKVWLAITSNKSIGFVAARQSDTEAELYGLWLLPGHDRSIAKQLGEVALEWLSTKKRITTRVAVHDRETLATYAQLGFEVNEAGPVDFIFLKSGHRLPTVEMHRLLRTTWKNPEGKQTILNKPKQKKLVRRNDLSKESGVRASTIKHYTEIGLLPFSQEGERLSRRYDLELSLKRLKTISKLRAAGRNLNQISKELKT